MMFDSSAVRLLVAVATMATTNSQVSINIPNSVSIGINVQGPLIEDATVSPVPTSAVSSMERMSAAGDNTTEETSTYADSMIKISDTLMASTTSSSPPSASSSTAITLGSGKYYVDVNTGTACVRDCVPVGTANCGGIVENAPWLLMFDTIADCCTEKLGWVDAAECAGPSPSPVAVVDDMNMEEVAPTSSPAPTTTLTSSATPVVSSMMLSSSSAPSSLTTNGTASPTIDLNPDNMYCFNGWWIAETGGDCGIPCPNGDECPASSPNCISRVSQTDGSLTCAKSHKVGVTSNWCAKSEPLPGVGEVAVNATSCHQACPGGTDAECPTGEKCWGDSPCALLPKKPSATWCARSYKHLVEECPKPCEGGTDAECGADETGKPMKCFKMEAVPEILDEVTGDIIANATAICSEPGVGVKAKVDPSNLWCGTDWNNVLENCAKNCVEGSDEECDIGSKCFDLSGNDLICEVAGVGVKPKGDPLKRYCGATYQDMMKSCPLKCPLGSECPDGQICFEESLCENVGEAAPGYVELDLTKMFCGATYEEAAMGTTSCPDEQCPENQSCFLVEELVDEDEEESSFTEMKESVETSDPEELVDEAEEESSFMEMNESVETSDPETSSAASEPAAAASASEPAAAASASEPAASEPEAQDEPKEFASSPFEGLETKAGAESTGVEVDNLRMALFGMPTLSTKQLAKWEEATATYVEQFYNNADNSDVFDVSTEYDVTSLNIGASSRRNLRKLQGQSAFLLTFSQTVNYSSDNEDTTVEDVIQLPFADPISADNYVNFLKEEHPDLFGELTGASTVMTPVPFESKEVMYIEDSNLPQTEDSNSSYPDQEEDNAEPDEVMLEPEKKVASPPVDSLESFHCHNSGEACPSGECPDDDLCLFFSDGEGVAIAPYAEQESESEVTAEENEIAPMSASVPVESSSSSSCNICRPDQVGINNPVNFNGELTDCAEVYDYMAKNYNMGETNCIAAQEALGSTCCGEIDEKTEEVEKMDEMSEEVERVPMTSSSGACSLCMPNEIGIDNEIEFNGKFSLCHEAVDFMAQNFDAGAPNCVAAREALGSTCCRVVDSETMDEMSEELISPTVAPTTSSSIIYVVPALISEESLARVAEINAKASSSFYCGSSWLNASDKCSKSCPSGDATECDDGEECFAWTSCVKTASFYCGSTFKEASKCEVPCPDNNSDESCPSGQGCFAYTTCEATAPVKSDTISQTVAAIQSDSFCGESRDHAAMTCSVACPSGEDSDCPDSLKCFDGTGCSIRDSFWCGKNWLEAAEMCTQPCSSGRSDDCGTGESCFSGTRCATEVDSPSSTQSFMSGVANSEWNVGTAVENPAAWKAQWMASDSSSSKYITIVGSLIATGSLLLSLAL